jgi:hypothetical protein
MNDEHQQRSRLIADLFHDDWANGPAGDLARAAAAHARRRRSLRRIVATTGATIGAAAALALALLYRPAAPRPATLSVRPAAAAYETISDDELLALLSDRPLLARQNDDGTRSLALLPN